MYKALFNDLLKACRKLTIWQDSVVDIQGAFADIKSTSADIYGSFEHIQGSFQRPLKGVSPTCDYTLIFCGYTRFF